MSSSIEQAYERSQELIQEQEAMLLALKKFHKICTENNIKYSLYGGTLLGAIRNKGFIPWDDDADVSLSRDNYKKLVGAMKRYKDDNIIFEDKIERIPRLIMKYEDKVVWIDLFIYDYISENKILQKIKIYSILFLDAFVKTKETMAYTKERGRYFGLKYQLFYIIYLFGSIFPVEIRINLLHKFSEKYLCGKKRSIFLSNDQYSGKLLIFPAQMMEAYINTAFEDTELMVTAKYNERLIRSYGEDYMIPHMYTTSVEGNVHDTVRKVLFDTFEKRKLAETDEGGVILLDIYRRRGVGALRPSERRDAA